MKWLKFLILGVFLGGCTFSGGTFGSSQSGLPQWKATTTNAVGDAIGNAITPRSNQKVYINDTATTTGNFTFMGELMPDGSTCSNGEILKKTGLNDWDCSTDGGGAGTSYAEFTQVGSNQQNVSSTPFLFTNGIQASSTSLLTVFTNYGSATTTATSTAQGFKALNLLSCNTIDTTAEGHFFCGTDATGAGGGGDGGGWQLTANILTPTSTGAGILVNAATSTITNLNMTLASTTERLVVGGNPTNNFGKLWVNGDSFFSGQATTTEGLTVDSGTLIVQSDNNFVGIGTINPSTILTVDTSSNSTGIRILGSTESTEISDIYVGINGNLVISNANTGASQGMITLDPEDDDWGVRIMDSNTGVVQYANLYFNNTATDYLNIVVNDTNSNLGLIINDLDQVSINSLAPSVTGLDFFVNGGAMVNGNATSSGWLNIGTTNGLSELMGAGDLYVGAEATTTGNFTFMAELMPDGLTCSDGQILKKTGVNDWDCAADNNSGGGTNDWRVTSTNLIGNPLFKRSLTATTTESLYVNEDLVVAGNATTSGYLVVGTTNPSGALTPGSVFFNNGSAIFKTISSGICFSNDGNCTTSNGKLTIGDNTDSFEMEIEDGGVCIGSTGCIAGNDGSLIAETNGAFGQTTEATSTLSVLGTMHIFGNATTTGFFNVGMTNPTFVSSEGDLFVGDDATITDQFVLSGIDTATAGTNSDLCISAAGIVINESTGTCIVSSRKFKHAIESLNIDGLSILSKLQPSSFIRDGEDITRYGFIAEEVAEVDSHLASYDLDGEPRGLDEHALIAVLIDAVQEQQEQIDSLEQGVPTQKNYSWIGLFGLFGFIPLLRRKR